MSASQSIEKEFGQLADASNQKFALLITETTETPQAVDENKIVNDAKSAAKSSPPVIVGSPDLLAIKNALSLDLVIVLGNRSQEPYSKDDSAVIIEASLPSNLDLREDVVKQLAAVSTEKYAFINIKNKQYFLSTFRVRQNPSLDHPSHHTAVIKGYELNKTFLTHLANETGLHLSLVNYELNDGQIEAKSGGNSVSSITSFAVNPEMLTSSQVTENHLSLLKPSVLLGSQRLFTREVKLDQMIGSPSSLFVSFNANRVSDNFIKLQSTIASIAFIAVVIAALLCLYIARRISTPIEALAKHSKQISLGNYSKLKNTESYSREINTLKQAFITMQESIAAREKEIRIQAEIDPQTQLYNRQYVVKHVENKLKEKETFQAINVNISDFRRINDTFGNQVGDHCLEVLAERVLPLGGICARITGAKFLWLPHDYQSEETLRQILRKLNEPIDYEHIPVPISVTTGVLECPEQAGGIKQFFRRLSILIEPAKLSPTSIAYFNSEMESDYLRKIEIIKHLKHAIDHEKEQFEVVYQPYINLQNRCEFRLEALLRWTTPSLGKVNPDEFIKIAEDTGMIKDITRHVVSTVLADLNKFQQTESKISVSINISANDLLNSDFSSFLQSILKSYEFGAETLAFELTESAVLQDVSNAISKMLELKALGFPIYIDDFGTGYSSLSYLSKLPADVLKIDKSFIMSMDESDVDKTLSKRIIQIAKDLNLDVVAEGIESKSSFDWLKAQGCDWGQGFYICKPQSFELTQEWIRQYVQKN